VLKVDILQSAQKPVHTLGHNSMAYFTYAGTGLLHGVSGRIGLCALRPDERIMVPRTLHVGHTALR